MRHLARISQQSCDNSHTLPSHLVPQQGGAVLFEHCPHPVVSQSVATKRRFVHRFGEKCGLGSSLIILILFPAILIGGPPALLKDLEIARYWESVANDLFPVSFNHLYSTGYFSTPSARMTREGEIGFGMASVPPYLLINGRIQPFSHLELGISYRIFCDVPDPHLSPKGFGDFADRGANIKFAVLTPEDSCYQLPGIALGAEDFMGTKRFENYYVVATQVWRDFGLEASLGWGTGRFSGPSCGFFGGLIWYPCWESLNSWIKGLGFSAEYDPIDYRDPDKEPHPQGHDTSFPLNYGIKFKLWNLFDFSASRIRGEANAFAGSMQYNWGAAIGFLPKISDPCPYRAPRETEPIGCKKPAAVMIQNLNFVLEEQGFRLTKAWIQTKGAPLLWIHLINCRYREEKTVRSRLTHILSSLTPSNIEMMMVTIESYGVACQTYLFPRLFLNKFANRRMSEFELEVITPRKEVVFPPGDASLIYSRRDEVLGCRLSPRFETFFGSAKGKVNYDLGVKANLEGFLPGGIYYCAQLSETVLSSLDGIGDYDIFHPSQLLNVATDFIRYRQMGNFSIDSFFLQKSWNLGRGLFTRIASGYFQVNYAGAAGEFLWYPARSCFAVGLEGASVKKRRYSGLGFQSKIRKFDGFTPVYESYTLLNQYFLDLYFDFPGINFFTKFSFGQFLARDKGIKICGTRYFKSGLRLSGWITFTDAHDMMHGETYYNRGFSIELPMDLFYKCSSRRVWNYGMAAWLRDAGYSVSTGVSLFEMVNRERR